MRQARAGRGFMEVPDEQLAALSLSGDPELFVDLLWRHGPAVHAYLVRRAGRQDADDLLGEVWLRAFKGRSTYDLGRSGVLPWLYGIARNVLRAHWRTATRQRGSPEAPAASDPWPDVDARLDAMAKKQQIQLVLGGLSDAEREVLLLVVWEHLTPAEVSIALGIPQGTTRSRLHRALSTLRSEERAKSSIPVNSRPKEL
jgi:RNA polymerase sigma factor (sigma-70 family)